MKMTEYSVIFGFKQGGFTKYPSNLCALGHYQGIMHGVK